MKWGQQAQSLYCPIFKILRNVFFYKHKFIKNKIFFSYRKIETNPSPTQLIYFSWIRFYTPSFIVITIWETAQIYRLNSVAQNINRTSYFASGNTQHCKKVYIMSIKIVVATFSNDSMIRLPKQNQLLCLRPTKYCKNVKFRIFAWKRKLELKVHNEPIIIFQWNSYEVLKNIRDTFWIICSFYNLLLRAYA